MANTLNGGRTYYVRARHKATNGLASEWSPPVRFTTSSASVAKPTLRTPTLAANGSTTLDGYSVPNPGHGTGYSNGTSYPQSFEVSGFSGSTGLSLKNLVVEWGGSSSFGQTITTASTIFTITTAPSQTYYFRFKYVSTANVESPWSDTYSFKTSSSSINLSNNYYISGLTKTGAIVSLNSTSFSASPTSVGIVLNTPNYSWINTSWSYRASGMGRICFYDAPIGGNLVGAINVPGINTSEFQNLWGNDPIYTKEYPFGVTLGRTYYLSLEAHVFNMVEFNTGSVSSEALLPTNYYGQNPRISLTLEDYPTSIDPQCLLFTHIPIMLYNGDLRFSYVNSFGNIVDQVVVRLFNKIAYIDFEVYSLNSVLTYSGTIGTDAPNRATYETVWEKVKLYRENGVTVYSIKARWRFTSDSGLITKNWVTLKA